MRKFDIVDNTDNLEFLASYKLPVYQGCVENNKFEEDTILDIIFDVGVNTGMIQIRNLLDLNIVYQENHNPGTVGNTWKNHHDSFCKFITKYNPNKIIEIGGGHGILSKNYIKHNPNINWTIIDPHTSKDLTVNVINEFYDENTKLDGDVDIVIHSHLLEHIYNPSKFFESLSQLNNGTKLLFSVPNLKEQLKLKYSSALSFEHVYLCSEEYIEYWLKLFGFYILEKQFYGESHSIFYSCVKENKQQYNIKIPNNYLENKSIFNKYLEYQLQYINKLNLLDKTNVYLFGACINSQFLLANGLNDKNIICIIDNDIKKHGKRLYGTKLFVNSPNILRKESNPIIILQKMAYSFEIKQDILQNINSQAIFLDEI